MEKNYAVMNANLDENGFAEYFDTKKVTEAKKKTNSNLSLFGRIKRFVRRRFNLF